MRHSEPLFEGETLNLMEKGCKLTFGIRVNKYMTGWSIGPMETEIFSIHSLSLLAAIRA